LNKKIIYTKQDFFYPDREEREKGGWDKTFQTSGERKKRKEKRKRKETKEERKKKDLILHFLDTDRYQGKEERKKSQTRFPVALSFEEEKYEKYEE
jgi:hypothetical protein